MDWNGKPYYSLDYYLKQTFGQKVYKLSLDGGMTCPNRDGTLGSDGCIFCSAGGSGDFAAPRAVSVTAQLEAARARVAKKAGASARYIAYFQSYTNTYAPVTVLESLFHEVISRPDITALSIATRPDCLPEDVVELLAGLNRIKPVWVELGLQTIHETTAAAIGRAYPLPVFEDALERLKRGGLKVIVHVILGLPGENREMMTDTVRYLGSAGRSQGQQGGIDGIKLQLLHILSGTKLAQQYESNPFPIFSLEEYLDLVIDCVALLPSDIVIHRLTGDGPKALLIAPLWSGNKRLVLNTLTRRFRERGITQGDGFPAEQHCGSRRPPQM